MSMQSAGAGPASSRPRNLLLASLVLTAGLTLTSLVFDGVYRETCAISASWKFCAFSGQLVARSLAVLLFAGLYTAALPDRVAPLLRAGGAEPLGKAGLMIMCGVLLVAGPAVLHGPDTRLVAVTSWALGTLMLACAFLRSVAPWSAWARAAAGVGPLFWILCALGLALPELGDMLFPLWHVEAFTQVSFAAVQSVAATIGLVLMAYPETYVLQHGDFGIRVGQSCSGIEGFVLITVFLMGYATLFRRQILVSRVMSILPLALAISWGLNIVRIVGLIWIGVNVSPTLAVEGFHSHAGWLMFTLLSVGLIAAIHWTPWFHRDRTAPAHRPLPPLRQDWNAARLLPFAVFMFSALVASTFWQDPALAYPLRAVAMGLVLWAFRDLIFSLPWRVDAGAAAAGIAIGVLWVVTHTPSTAEAAGLNALGPLGFGIWVVARVLGTTLLVPVIEELFFRSYLLERLAPNRGGIASFFAVIASTACFAALHDRWMAAALAGLVLAWLVLRKGGRVTDAILAHIVANGLIALWALSQGDWSAI